MPPCEYFTLFYIQCGVYTEFGIEPLLPRAFSSWQIFYAANAIRCFSIGVTTPRLRCTRCVL